MSGTKKKLLFRNWARKFVMDQFGQTEWTLPDLALLIGPGPPKSSKGQWNLWRLLKQSYTGQMPFPLPNQQRQSAEVNAEH